MKKSFLICLVIVIIIFVNIYNLKSQVFINNNPKDIDSLFKIEYKNQILDVLNEKIKLLTLKNEFIKVLSSEKNKLYNLDTLSMNDFHKQYIYKCQNLLHLFINKDSIEIRYEIKQNPSFILFIDCKITYKLLKTNNTLYMLFSIYKGKLIGDYID
ncbi:MAG: hypothetical protein NTW25_11750 [Candidatus Kapabacteria bacterium]|nr:hypothetical protein [Candidatus Kapabacteria bacterium]